MPVHYRTTAAGLVSAAGRAAKLDGQELVVWAGAAQGEAALQDDGYNLTYRTNVCLP